jgi:hypothetical protein
MRLPAMLLGHGEGVVPVVVVRRMGLPGTGMSLVLVSGRVAEVLDGGELMLLVSRCDGGSGLRGRVRVVLDRVLRDVHQGDFVVVRGVVDALAGGVLAVRVAADMARVVHAHADMVDDGQARLVREAVASLRGR